MTVDRRKMLAAGLGAGASLAAATVALAEVRSSDIRHKIITIEPEPEPASIEPSPDLDRVEDLQARIDAAAAAGRPLVLPAGRIRAGTVRLKPGSHILGSGPQTVLQFAGGEGAFILAEDADDIRIENLSIDGAGEALEPALTEALVHLTRCRDVVLDRLRITNSTLSGIALHRASGRIASCSVSRTQMAGIRSLDGDGVEIIANTVTDCANNGIQIWRTAVGEDGTIVSGNRVERVEAKAGGSGEFGNGINVFRAGGVLVTGNRIADCAYSAIRANASSNIQMVANNCARIGEVALYAEFGFEGALICANIIDTAASGIAVTNFNEGGRLAVVQGNLIRNLVRREHEPVDKRGVGISVEADSLVSANTIEKAETCGIMAGWGAYLRDCAVTQNLVRGAPVGILLSDHERAGSVLVSGNLVSETSQGAIRMMTAEGDPTGPDLSTEPERKGRVTITGNLTTGASTSGWPGWFSRG
jgi:uncharacterized secreted repeat protein (TIGR03808 family)